MGMGFNGVLQNKPTLTNDRATQRGGLGHVAGALLS